MVHKSAIEVFVEYINKTSTQTQGFGLESLVLFVPTANHVQERHRVATDPGAHHPVGEGLAL